MRYVGDEGGGDTSRLGVLVPVDGGDALLDGKNSGGDGQEEANNAGDGGQNGDALTVHVPACALMCVPACVVV